MSTPTIAPDAYRHRGIRALVLLHEDALRDSLATWRQAKGQGCTTPASEDPSYASMETLLQHVFRAARGYLVWLCEVFELPDPEVRPTPEPEVLAQDPEGYLDHLLARWRVPMTEITEEVCDRREARSRWGVTYCPDAMLEHAVVHPMRHGFQLREWMR